MTPALALLPVLWAGTVLAGAAAARYHRLPVARSLPLLTATAATAHGGAGRAAALAVGVDGALRRVGRVVLVGLLRRGGPDPAAQRYAGMVVVTAVVATGAHPLLGGAALAAGAAVPVLARRHRRQARAAQLESELPDVVDLFLLAVDAGLTVPLAVAAVGARAPGALAAEFAVAAAETARGRRLADALEQVPDRTTEAVRPLTAALVASERYGTPVGIALERLATEVRIAAQRRAEETARRVPVALLFPLVICILPAFALLTVAPLVANGLRSLRL